MTIEGSYDPEQMKFMQEEDVILCDEQDNIIGSASKLDSHLVVNGPPLHRAFSVFLFNKEGKLLLHQRAASKITFPLCWTNTCCSHPLSNIEEEKNGVEGAKLAAKRKLYHELGIKPEAIQLDDFKFLTRIIYKAPFDEKWGEHEVDYIFFLNLDTELQANPNEVEALKFVSEDELKQIINDQTLQITPWFRLICKRFLFEWWDNKENWQQFVDNQIHVLQ